VIDSRCFVNYEVIMHAHTNIWSINVFIEVQKRLNRTMTMGMGLA